MRCARGSRRNRLVAVVHVDKSLRATMRPGTDFGKWITRKCGSQMFSMSESAAEVNPFFCFLIAHNHDSRYTTSGRSGG
jgi:hypothetical protein